MFKRKLFFALGSFMLMSIIAALPAYAGNGNTTGTSVDCVDGGHFDNGVEVTVVQMRAGYTYTATAIGIDGFDPVLAVLDDRGDGLCTDDDNVASYYDVELPSTGYVPTSNTSSQVRFAQTSGRNMSDVSLVVGGYGNTSGEFVLILEGMAVTSADGDGDPFAITINESMISSGIPLGVYMISRTDALDPLIYGLDASGNYLTDVDNNDIFCDDSGDSTSCWGESVKLSKYAISTRDGALSGGPYDSMLYIPLSEDNNGLQFDLMMTSSHQQTLGQYMVVIHAGTSTTPLSNPDADMKPNA